MFRYGFFWRLLTALVVIGLLAATGTAVFRAGWAQGYQTGVLATAPEGSQVAPLAPGAPFYAPYPGYGYWPGYGFPHFGLFFFPLIGLFLLLFLFGGLFRMAGWRRWAGHPGHGDWGQRPVPPWAKEWHERFHAEQEKGADRPESPGENA